MHLSCIFMFNILVFKIAYWLIGMPSWFSLLAYRIGLRMQRKRIKREERYDQLIACATKVFSKKGFKSTTTKDISKAAGVSEKLIYIHFKSKQELFLKCLTAVEREIATECGSIIHEYRDDPIGCLEQIGLYLFNYLEKKKYLSGIVSISAREMNNKAIKERYKTILATYADTIETIARCAIDKGYMTDILDPRAYAWLYVGNYSTFLMMKEFNFEEFNKDFAKRILNILIYGYVIR